MENYVDKDLLMESLAETYKQTLDDNNDYFLCMIDMITTLVATLKLKGILTEEEAKVIYDIPKERLGGKKE